jgi:anthranilate phosphoribosyltransferase
MKATLGQLYEHVPLDRPSARATLLSIARGEVNPVQSAAFISALNMRAVTVAELSGFRDAMIEVARPFDLEGRQTIDIVGTGGDGKNTFNISTLSCVVVAGAGYQVTKHGSYGVSSSVGSSDVLLALGYEFTNDTDELRRQLDRAGICFLHAPLFHPAMKEVVPVRKQLAIRSFFNMLGPLINPGEPTHQLFGVFSLELSRLYHYMMQTTEREYSIAYALDGYDEVSLTGPARIRTRYQDRVLLPADFGLPRLQPAQLDGGTTAEAGKEIFLSVLRNESTPAQRDAVLANAGLAIKTLKPEQALTDCVAEARASLESGRALQTLQKLLES